MPFGELTQPAHATKKAVVLTADQFEDMELSIPVYRLLEAGWHVDIAAPTMDAIQGEHGYPMMAYPRICRKREPCGKTATWWWMAIWSRPAGPWTWPPSRGR